MREIKFQDKTNERKYISLHFLEYEKFHLSYGFYIQIEAKLLGFEANVKAFVEDSDLIKIKEGFSYIRDRRIEDFVWSTLYQHLQMKVIADKTGNISINFFITQGADFTTLNTDIKIDQSFIPELIASIDSFLLLLPAGHR